MGRYSQALHQTVWAPGDEPDYFYIWVIDESGELEWKCKVPRYVHHSKEWAKQQAARKYPFAFANDFEVSAVKPRWWA